MVKQFSHEEKNFSPKLMVSVLFFSLSTQQYDNSLIQLCSFWKAFGLCPVTPMPSNFKLLILETNVFLILLNPPYHFELGF